MIRCGILGYGKMGRIRERAIVQSGRGSVTAVYDPEPLPDCSYPVCEHEEDILTDPDIDAVFVCTPNYRIAPLCIAGLEAGKHVFSEKPPAFTADELLRVIECEKKAGKVLMYGFNHRHHDSVQRMKGIIDSGEMGRPLWMRGRYGKEVNEDFFRGWRADKRLAGGGIMLDQGIHMLDLFLYLGGGFDQVQAMVSNLFWQIDGIEDNVFAQFRNTETGVCASLHSTMTQWRYLFSLEVFLEHGALVLNGLRTNSGVYGDEELSVKYNTHRHEEGGFESEQRFVYRGDNSWDSEISMFFDAVEDDRRSWLGDSSDALCLMRLMDQIYARA